MLEQQVDWLAKHLKALPHLLWVHKVCFGILGEHVEDEIDDNFIISFFE
jgi:hypothetical protein